MPLICLIDVPLPDDAFYDHGWDVVRLTPDGAEFDVAEALARTGSPAPDLLLQAERLAPRILLRGLEEMTCPTLFWSLDTHLNLFWQKHYARLFDGVLTTQPAWMEQLHDAGCPSVGELTWYGHVRPFVPWRERTHDLAFVGRLSGIRPVRRWLTEFMCDHLDGRVESEIDFSEMLDVYGNARMVPNESIMGEVNMRLFEAASCGCLVLAQEIDGQERFFTPGVHVAVQRDALELMETASYYRARPDVAERMGRAARAHVLEYHLPEHRAAALLNFAATLARTRLVGTQAEKAFWRTVVELALSGRIRFSPRRLRRGLEIFSPEAAETSVMHMRLLHAEKRASAERELLGATLAANLHPDDATLNMVFSCAALALDDLPTARRFWFRQAGDSRTGKIPDTPADLYMSWARLLRRLGQVRRADFTYDTRHHLPACAMDCLGNVLHIDEEHREAAQMQAALLPPGGGHEAERIASLSVLSRHQHGDWRTGLRLGLANLSAYRLEQGMGELHSALTQARSQGKEGVFTRMLAEFAPGPYAARALELD